MLKDNPFRDTPEYRAKLQMTPEPLRSQLIYGDFSVGQVDRAFQVIPTAWIKAAQARWKSTPPPGVPMCAMGVDVAQGGEDCNVMAVRTALRNIDTHRAHRHQIGRHTSELQSQSNLVCRLLLE